MGPSKTSRFVHSFSRNIIKKIRTVFLPRVVVLPVIPALSRNGDGLKYRVVSATKWDPVSKGHCHHHQQIRAVSEASHSGQNLSRCGGGREEGIGCSLYHGFKQITPKVNGLK